MFMKKAVDAIRPLLQHLILFPVFKHFAESIEIEGLEHLSKIGGAVVLVANHASHADTAAILYALPAAHRKRLCIAAAADYFYANKLIGTIVTVLMNTFPFERDHPRKALHQAKDILKEGQSLLIYPEGTRSIIEQEEVHFKRGFAAVACQLGLPVIPIRLEGSREMLPKGRFWPQKAHIRIAFGEPIYPAGHNSNEVAHLAEQRVQDMAHAA